MANEDFPVSGEKRSPRERKLNLGTGKQPDTGNDTMYRDRPSDDGTNGDAGQQPNSGFPHKTE